MLSTKVNDFPSKYVGLKADKNDSYSANIQSKMLSFLGGDSIRYRIFAMDSAKVPQPICFTENRIFLNKN